MVPTYFNKIHYQFSNNLTMKKIIYSFAIILLMISCKQLEADLIVINANIYTVNDDFSKAEAFAIKDGKFMGVGSNSEITIKYNSKTTLERRLIPALFFFDKLGVRTRRG